MTSECICGQHGHPFAANNCPQHGRAAELERKLDEFKATMVWHESTNEETRSTVLGNLNGFVAFLCRDIR